MVCKTAILWLLVFLKSFSGRRNIADLADLVVANSSHPDIPRDCSLPNEVWVTNGHDPSDQSNFEALTGGPVYSRDSGVCRGLCSCYNTEARMPKYVKYEILQSADRGTCFKYIEKPCAGKPNEIVVVSLSRERVNFLLLCDLKAGGNFFFGGDARDQAMEHTARVEHRAGDVITRSLEGAKFTPAQKFRVFSSEGGLVFSLEVHQRFIATRYRDVVALRLSKKAPRAGSLSELLNVVMNVYNWEPEAADIRYPYRFQHTGCDVPCDGKNAEKGAMCYQRSHLTFKANPALCQACGSSANVRTCASCRGQTSPKSEAFGGSSCPACKEVEGKFSCSERGSPENRIGEFCAFYSAFEDKVCPAWKPYAGFYYKKYEDYDLGHLAASSDTYDRRQAQVFCKKRTTAGRAMPVSGNEGRAFIDLTSCKWHASYMMTNIVAQGTRFNRGCWRDLEKAINHYALVEDIDVSSGSDMKNYRLRVSAYQPKANELGDNIAGVPHYMFKAVCQKGPNPKCVGWYMENRNIYMVRGCRTPLTLDELAAKLNLPFVPGFDGIRSSGRLDDLVAHLRCAPSEFNTDCAFKDALYDNMNEAELDPTSGTCDPDPIRCRVKCDCCDEEPSRNPTHIPPSPLPPMEQQQQQFQQPVKRAAFDDIARPGGSVSKRMRLTETRPDPSETL